MVNPLCNFVVILHLFCVAYVGLLRKSQALGTCGDRSRDRLVAVVAAADCRTRTSPAGARSGPAPTPPAMSGCSTPARPSPRYATSSTTACACASPAATAATPTPASGAANSIAFTAETAFAEALVGYLKRFGPLTAKAFVGIAAIEHDIAPLDPENPVQGQELGPKLAAEFWLNMGASAWSSLDLSWTSAHQTAAARLAHRLPGLR